jgi:ABC-type multidrug transport system fused ATPase/permease subunit
MALLEKDFYVVKVHWLVTALELVFPILLAILASFILRLEDFSWGNVGFGFIRDLRANQNTKLDFMGATGVDEYIPSSLLYYLSGTVFHSFNLLLDASIAGFTDPSSLSLLALEADASGYRVHHQNAPFKDTIYAVDQLWKTRSQLHPVDYSYGGSLPMFNARVVSIAFAVTSLTMSFLPLTWAMATRLLAEKTDSPREYLMVLGLSPFTYTLAHLLSGMLRVLLASSCATIVLCTYGRVDGTQGILLFVFLLLHGLGLITWTFLMPTLFRKPLAAICCTTLFLVVIGGASSFATMLPAPAHYVIAFFFTPFTFFCGAAQILAWDRLALPVMTVTAFMYVFLAHIIEGDLSCLRLWSANKKKAMERVAEDGTAVELDDVNLLADDASVVLMNLTKQYPKSDRPAVRNLSLIIRRKEILALLGHNGAGKTTSISILTGMLLADSYTTATVDGYDLEKGISDIRMNLGICPQFDVLVGDLSARQMLTMCAKLRCRPGVSNVDELLVKLNLPLSGQLCKTLQFRRSRIQLFFSTVLPAVLVLAGFLSIFPDPYLYQQGKTAAVDARHSRTKGNVARQSLSFDPLRNLEHPVIVIGGEDSATRLVGSTCRHAENIFRASYYPQSSLTCLTAGNVSSFYRGSYLKMDKASLFFRSTVQIGFYITKNNDTGTIHLRVLDGVACCGILEAFYYQGFNLRRELGELRLG